MLGQREPMDDPSETHGVCAVHSERLLEQLPSAAFPGIRMLLVVRRSETALFDHLTRSLAPLSDVAVMFDRRHGERRQATSEVAADRRRADRRIRKSPFSSLGYLLVRFGAARQPASALSPFRRLRVV